MLDQEIQLLDLIDYHNKNSQFVTIDTETTSLNPRDARILDIQIRGYDDKHYFIFDPSLAHHLLNLKPTLVGHNYKYDAHVLYHHGVDLLNHTWRDTMLLGHLADENRQSYSLDSYVQGLWKDKYKEEFWNKYDSYQDAPVEERQRYAGLDIIYTTKLYRFLLGLLKAQQIHSSLVDHVHDLQKWLLRTEIKGVRVDLKYLEETGIRVNTELLELQPKLRQLAEPWISLIEVNKWELELLKRKTSEAKARVKRPEFSFDSSQQLQSLLYDHLRLEKQYNEKTKSVSTDVGSLRELENDHPLIPCLLNYRKLTKIKGTYIDGTYERMENETIYPEFRVNGTVTGRISHSNPNLGQLPRAGGIRGIYAPAPGNCFLSADYSQLEVCLEANFTGDKTLSKLFQEGRSKHDVTAERFGIDKKTAKTLNFALQYWASHFKVAKILGISESEGKKVWDEYWELYRGCKELKSKTDRMVDQGEPIISIFGRKRRFPLRKRMDWDGDYRQAYNFLIQSSGADITSRSFCTISEYLARRRVGRGLFTVHDELLVECRNEAAAEVEESLKDAMIKVGDELGLEIPLKVESSGSMDRWLD